MAHWVDRTPPRRNTGLGIGLLVIAVIWLVALLVWAGRDAGATGTCEYTYNGCTTTTPYVTTTAPTTTAATTTIATTTTAPTTTVPVTNPQCTECTTTTTVPRTTTTTTAGRVDCSPAFDPNACTTTTAATTTVPSTTTTAPTTTVAATTVPPPPDDGALPPTGADAPVPDELPVTGGSPWWLALFGVCLLALGGLAVAFKRS